MNQRQLETSQYLIQAIGHKAAMDAEKAYSQATKQVNQLSFAYLIENRISSLGFKPMLYFDREVCIGVPAQGEQIAHIKAHLKACGFIITHILSQPSHNGTDYVYSIKETEYEQHQRPKQATVVFQED